MSETPLPLGRLADGTYAYWTPSATDLLITGRGGSGKSSMAQWLAAQAARVGYLVYSMTDDSIAAKASRRPCAMLDEIIAAAYGEGFGVPMVLVLDGLSFLEEDFGRELEDLARARAISGAPIYVAATRLTISMPTGATWAEAGEAKLLMGRESFSTLAIQTSRTGTGAKGLLRVKDHEAALDLAEPYGFSKLLRGY